MVGSRQQKEALVLTEQEQLLMRVDGVKNAGSANLFLATHVDNWEALNCQGTQERHSECKWKAGLSQEWAKWPCGCEDVLLQCLFVGYIDNLQNYDAAFWQSLSEQKQPKYFACPKATCANPKQLYEWSQIFQSRLRQMLNDKTVLPFFSLHPRARLAPAAHQAIRQWAAKEDSLIYDNSDELKEEMKSRK